MVAFDAPGEVAAGATVPMTFTVSGGQNVGAGVDISASGGALGTADTTLRLSRGELTQRRALRYEDGAAVFHFLFTAPNRAGTVTLYGAGNSVDGNGGTSGDAWALGQVQVQVTVPEPDAAPPDAALPPDAAPPERDVAMPLPDAAPPIDAAAPQPDASPARNGDAAPGGEPRGDANDSVGGPGGGAPDASTSRAIDEPITVNRGSDGGCHQGPTGHDLPLLAFALLGLFPFRRRRA
jgi:hypothetical protein